MVNEMKEENWVRNTNPVREWLVTAQESAKTLIITNTIEVGDSAENDEERYLYWGTIRNMGKSLKDEGFPEGQRGRQNDRPLSVMNNVTIVKNRVISAFVGITDGDLMLEVRLPHGKTGGAFDSLQQMAEKEGQKSADVLITAYDEGRWNGELTDAGLTGMVPPPLKKKAETITVEVDEEE